MADDDMGSINQGYRMRRPTRQEKIRALRALFKESGLDQEPYCARVDDDGMVSWFGPDIEGEEEPNRESN